MSEIDAPNQPAPWKSKLLESLGVKSAVVIEHGVSGQRCGRALTAALAMAVGAFAAPVAAAENSIIQPNQVQQVAPALPDGKGENSAFYDAARLTSSLVLGRLLYEADEPETVTQRAFGIAGSALRLSAATPLMGTYMVLDEIHGTYQFVQERQQRAVDEKLIQVSERVARVQRDEVLRIRMEERATRTALPPAQRAADHGRMVALVLEANETGLSTELEARLEIEQAIERAGQPTEEWYSEYKAQSATQEVSTEDSLSARSKFMGGMSRMNTALDNLELAAQIQPSVRPPSLR
jgi:hypothetical protein